MKSCLKLCDKKINKSFLENKSKFKKITSTLNSLRVLLKKKLFNSKHKVTNINSFLKMSIIKASRLKKTKILFNFIKKKSIKQLNNNLNAAISLKKKKLKLEYILNTMLPYKVELKLNNFLSSKGTPMLFKAKYRKLYINYKQKKLNFYNKQFKEIFSSLAIALLLCKSSMLTLIISRVLGSGRFRFFKRNLYYIFNNLFLLQRKLCPFNAVRVNISGKFKGKAKRTNLRYKLSPGVFKIRSFIPSKINFYVGFVMTQTGIFGIKV